nr:MAG TPA: hypothetical protein [Caudoviricetes sp.]
MCLTKPTKRAILNLSQSSMAKPEEYEKEISRLQIKTANVPWC